MSIVSCGVSCDSGSALIYIHNKINFRPKLIWQFESGSSAYGGALTSIRVKNKIITHETYGRCPPPTPGQTDGCSRKFDAKDIIRRTFAFKGRNIAEQTGISETTPVVAIMNEYFEINMNNQITEMEAKRENADDHTMKMRERIKNGVIAGPDFGDGSALCESFGYIRRSARRDGFARGKKEADKV